MSGERPDAAMVAAGYWDAPEDESLPPTELCECDKLLHEPGKERCPNEPTDHGTVVASPALCIRCLNYCWNDDEEF